MYSFTDVTTPNTSNITRDEVADLQDTITPEEWLDWYELGLTPEGFEDNDEF